MSVWLETERLVLRELDPGDPRDVAFMLALLNDPGWLAKLGDPGVRDAAGAAAYIERACAASYRANGFGMYGVERKSAAGAELVGISGLIRREVLDAPDLGFAFLEGHTRQGLATEAGRAALTDARARLGLARVVAITDEGNLGSLVVLERLGFRCEGRVRLRPDADELMLFGLALGGGPAVTV